MIVLELVILLPLYLGLKKNWTSSKAKTYGVLCYILLAMNALSLIGGASDISKTGPVMVMAGVGLILDILLLMQRKNINHSDQGDSGNKQEENPASQKEPEKAKLKNYGKAKRGMLFFLLVILPVFILLAGALLLHIMDVKDQSVYLAYLIASIIFIILMVLIYRGITEKAKDLDKFLYLEAEKAGIQDPLHSATDFEKLKLLAKAERGCRHLSDKKLLELYSNGKIKYGQHLLDRQEEARKKAHQADETSKASLERYARLVGRDKRVRMLEPLLKKARDSAKTWQNAASYSFQDKREVNEGIRGGIAQGIAGVGAGVAAALDAKNQNDQIRAWNSATRSQRQDAKKSAAYNAGVQTELAAKLEKAILQAKTAMVSDPLTKREMIANYCIATVISRSVSVTDGGSLHLKVSLFPSTGIHDISDSQDQSAGPEWTVKDRPAVLDGALTVHVFDGERKLDSCAVVLPLEGYDGKPGMSLEGMCTGFVFSKDMLEQLKYEIEPDKIWLIEKQEIPSASANLKLIDPLLL